VVIVSIFLGLLVKNIYLLSIDNIVIS